jgi:hypothetical protein
VWEKGKGKIKDVTATFSPFQLSDGTAVMETVVTRTETMPTRISQNTPCHAPIMPYPNLTELSLKDRIGDYRSNRHLTCYRNGYG